MKKFWPQVNQPASNGPFWPKLWMSLATVFVEILETRTDVVLDLYEQPHGRNFQSLKKWRFEIF